MKVEPAAAVTRTRIQSDRIRAAGDGGTIPARFSDDGGGLARDRGFVHRSDALDHFTVRRDDIAGFDENHVADLQLSPRHQLEILPVWAG